MDADESPNALTVDLEEYFQVSNFERVIARESWDRIPSRVEGATRRLLDLFDATGSRATFFCLGWVAERQPALIRELRDRGHEVASHGYGHQLVYEIGPERFREDLKRSRQAIEDAVGERVRGYRAPSFSVCRESLWALEILVEEGFEYDSSIFPISHPRYGIPDFTRTPVRLALPSGASLLEFPMTTLRLGPVNLPLSGGAYLRFFPPALFRWGLGHLESSGSPTMLYTHPWELDPEQPMQAVGWKTRVNHYFNLRRTEPRLAGLLRGFRFTTVDSVFERLEKNGRLPDYALSDGSVH